MSEKTLLEPSIVDALKAIETATDLPVSKKTHWACSLRQICTYLNRPPEIVPARWSGVKNAIYELHAARVGANAKTLANHKSNVRAALLWFAEEKNLPKSGVPLMPAWAALMGRVADLNRRKRLSGLARYCSAAKTVPGDVNEEVLDKYMRYRGETTRLAANKAARRVIARAWNACVAEIKEWPKHGPLIEPLVKPLTETARCRAFRKASGRRSSVILLASRRSDAGSVESVSAPVRCPPSRPAGGNCRPLPAWRFVWGIPSKP